MAGPFISVVTPAFNAEKTLRETVASALASDLRDFELIIVDDGSTDATPVVAAKLAARDPRVRVITRDNGGLPAALNSGFRAARGEYIARLDADDVWHPRKLSRQADFALQSEQIAFIYTFFRYLDETGRVFLDGPVQIFPSLALARGVWETILGTGSSVLIKRAAVEAVGGCEESPRTWEDLLLQLKISDRFEIGFVPEYLVGIRLRSDSLSQHREAMLLGWLELHARINALFPHVPRFVHSWGHGNKLLEMAEIHFWRKDYFGAAKLLALAFRHDPAWIVNFLAYRTGRHLRGHRQTHPKAAQPADFFEYDPSEPSDHTPYGLPAEGGRLSRLRRRREILLAELDLRLAALTRDLPPEDAQEMSPSARDCSYIL